MVSKNVQVLVDASRRLACECNALRFAEPVTHVYNPLVYAKEAHEAYLSRMNARVSVIFLGMNPGPWGMAQTGVPFGEIAAVRDWLGISKPVGKPAGEHPKRPVAGFHCGKSEVSGRRLWGLFQQRFGDCKSFFKEHFVLNYCPLVFMEASARNRTPDKLPAAERSELDAVCDDHLQTVLQTLKPKYAVGVGVYAETCLKRNLQGLDLSTTVARILHPSPASPAANRGWAEQATKQLHEAGIWE